MRAQDPAGRSASSGGRGAKIGLHRRPLHPNTRPGATPATGNIRGPHGAAEGGTVGVKHVDRSAEVA